jgi:hypothetical protein
VLGPQVGGGEAFDGLLVAVTEQGVDELGWQGVAAHGDGAGVEVDVAPAQAERFALAQAEGEGDEPAGAVAGLGGGGDDAGGFLLGEGIDLAFDEPGGAWLPVYGSGDDRSGVSGVRELSQKRAVVSAHRGRGAAVGVARHGTAWACWWR